MTSRHLGKNGPLVSAIGLGCMGMSQSYGPGDEDESIRTIHRALDLGITFVDTADAYGEGANELLVGKAIRSRRTEVVLATKFGFIPGSSPRIDGTPTHVREACEASLKRLGVETIDLYYLHRVDPNVPIEETVGAMAELVQQGSVRHLGLSEVAPSTLRRAHRIHPIAALQSEYSLWFREPEAAVLPACRELGIGFVPFSPLGRGFLSGQVKDVNALSTDDMRRRVPRFQGENLQRNYALVERLQHVAQRKRCTPSQLALAWLLGKGNDIVPIPGTKRQRYVEENAAAVDIALSDRDLEEIEGIFGVTAAMGERYPADLMRLVDRG